jgi:hypothetical protein
MRPGLPVISWSIAVTDHVHSSDNLLAQYLGASLQTATIRLAGALIVAAAVIALVIEIL